jgi:hypothetical protein
MKVLACARILFSIILSNIFAMQQMRLIGRNPPVGFGNAFTAASFHIIGVSPFRRQSLKQ